MQQSIKRSAGNQRDLKLFKRILKEQLERVGNDDLFGKDKEYNDMILELCHAITVLEENPSFEVYKHITDNIRKGVEV